MESSLSFKFEHKHIIQSYIFTTARYDYTLYEKRILYRLVEYAQSEIQGLMIRDNLTRIQHNLKDVSIAMPISSILVTTEKSDVNKHYFEAKKACRALGKKYLEWEDLEKGEYWGDNIIYNINIKKKEGIMRFHVVNWVWDAILDFSKGFRKFDIAIAMKLHSQYSMRFFEIMAGQQKIIIYTIEELRKMFYLGENKYKLTADLKKRILDPSKKELDRISPYSFEFVPNFEGNKIVSYTFYPTHLVENEDKNLTEIERTSKVTARRLLEQNIYEYLKYSFGFKSEEINKNKRTLLEGQNKINDFYSFLVNLRPNALKKDNPKAYVIGSIKRAVKEVDDSKKGTPTKIPPHTTQGRVNNKISQLTLQFSSNT